ncbi:hypothetical protein Tco_1189936 [Tanacetum coccineum]
MAASTQALIDAFTAGSPSFPSPPPINPTYDQAPLGHRAAMIRMRDDILEEDMPPRRRFVLTAPPPGCDIVESFVAAAARASRAADRVEDVGYARALQASEHRMMTSIEGVNLRVSYQVQARKRESKDFYIQLLDARTDCRDIRLDIDVVRGQRTAYETELQEFLQYILDLYFKYFKLSEDVVTRLLQVILDLQYFKSSLFNLDSNYFSNFFSNSSNQHH